MSDADPFLTSFVALMFCLVSVGLIALAFAFVIGSYRRAARLLSQWAASNGYRIIESERRKFFKGPFFWGSSNNQIIFRVTVQDAYGNIRRGWVRCGSYLLGAWNDEVDFRWDD